MQKFSWFPPVFKSGNFARKGWKGKFVPSARIGNPVISDMPVVGQISKLGLLCRSVSLEESGFFVFLRHSVSLSFRILVPSDCVQLDRDE